MFLTFSGMNINQKPKNSNESISNVIKITVIKLFKQNYLIAYYFIKNLYKLWGGSGIMVMIA